MSNVLLSTSRLVASCKRLILCVVERDCLRGQHKHVVDSVPLRAREGHRRLCKRLLRGRRAREASQLARLLTVSEVSGWGEGGGFG